MVDNCSQLLWLKIIKIIHHNRTANQPLSIKLTPGCFCPSCFRNRKMQAVFLCLMPVLCRDDMCKRITVIMNYTFRISCSAGCKIQHHRIRRQGLHTFKFFRSFFHSFCHIFKAVCIPLYTPELCCHASLFQRFGNFSWDLVLCSAYKCLCLRSFHAIYKIADRQHMRYRYHHCTQLVQCHCSKPVFVVPLQDQHNTISVAYSCTLKHIRHLIAVLFYICK